MNDECVVYYYTIEYAIQCISIHSLKLYYYSVVTLLLLYYYYSEATTLMLLWCYSTTTLMLLWCYSDATCVCFLQVISFKFELLPISLKHALIVDSSLIYQEEWLIYITLSERERTTIFIISGIQLCKATIVPPNKRAYRPQPIWGCESLEIVVVNRMCDTLIDKDWAYNNAFWIIIIWSHCITLWSYAIAI